MIVGEPIAVEQGRATIAAARSLTETAARGGGVTRHVRRAWRNTRLCRRAALDVRMLCPRSPR